MDDWLFFLAFFVPIVVITLLIVRREYRHLRTKSTQEQARLLARDTVFDVLGAVFFALLMGVWCWRDAPAGSLQRAGWILCVAFAVALVLWLAFRIVGKMVNREGN